MKTNCWNYIDTRSKSGKIAHHINVKAHFTALANAKNCVKLHKPDPTWLKKLEEKKAAEEKAEK